MKSIVDFHRPIAVRSASPRPDREPEKRGMPPTPAPEYVEPPRDKRPFPPEAVETFRKSEQLGIDVAGVISSKCLIGKAPTGERVPLPGDPWWWSPRNRVAIPCEGAVWEGSIEATRIKRGISEAAAMRADRAAFLASFGVDDVPPMRLARAKMKRGMR